MLDLRGDHRGAQVRYRAGLAVAPENIALRNNLGLSLALSGDYDDAIAALQPAALKPTAGARARQTLALVHGLAGNPAAAARIARVDLDESAVRANLVYYEQLRVMADRQRTAAIQAATAVEN